jgi:hypothetical protein
MTLFVNNKVSLEISINIRNKSDFIFAYPKSLRKWRKSWCASISDWYRLSRLDKRIFADSPLIRPIAVLLSHAIELRNKCKPISVLHHYSFPSRTALLDQMPINSKLSSERIKDPTRTGQSTTANSRQRTNVG